VRVGHAASLLLEGETAAGVAAACGFADQAHLIRAFKARMGITPREYTARGQISTTLRKLPEEQEGSISRTSQPGD
jgi:AraC-like DNA-binding protein